MSSATPGSYATATLTTADHGWIILSDIDAASEVVSDRWPPAGGRRIPISVAK